MRPGIIQLLIILVIVVLIFGAKKLPDIARAIGRSSGEFKRGLREGNEAAREKADEIRKELTDDQAK